jgi:hypothetical protein
MNTIAQDFAEMRAALLAWSASNDGNAYEDAHDLGRRLICAKAQSVSDVELQHFTCLLLAYAFSREAPLEIDISAVTEEDANVDFLQALVEKLSAATHDARYPIN